MKMTLARSWHELLKGEIDKPYIYSLKQFLHREEEDGATIYPPAHLVFNAFSFTNFEDVKVVIMGQDPYHGFGQAHGLSFSVPKGIAPPPSLKNIFKELHHDLNIIPPNHGCLEDWAQQGVLLLNATLTVREGQPKSHFGMGWETFTDEVIRLLCSREKPMVFLLWGKSAQEKCARILDQVPHNHAVLIAAHPSPFSATRFLGCRHFSKTNEYLTSWGQEPINWDLKK